MTEPERLSRDQLMREAASWFARMRGPDAESHREAFESWLARGALHRSAYNRAAEIFAMGKLLAEDESAAKPARAPGLGHKRMKIAALAAALALAVAAWLVLLGAPAGAPDGGFADSGAPTATKRFTSGEGESRRVVLADGSALILAGGTMVDVAFSPRERRLVLRRGRSRFEVFHERRPFVVHAGGARVTARGTVFDVALSPRLSVTVRLVEGIVDVAVPAGAAAGRTPERVRRLSAGETVTIPMQATGRPSAGDGSQPALPSPAAAAREFDGVRLSELIAQANRLGNPPIRLADPALGERRVSGRFRIDEPERLAVRLAALLELKVDRSDPEALVLRAR